MVFENLVPTLLQLISEHGVIAVMLGMVIEEVIVPIPSPVIPMAAGAAGEIISAQAWQSAAVQVFFLIALPASIASVVSSYFVYSIAYFGGKPAVKNYGRWLDISWVDVERMEKHFDSGREKYYVAFFRAVPVVPLSLVSGGAGLFRMDWKQYGVWSFIGMVPRNFFLAMLGWWASDQFLFYANQIDSLSTSVFLLVLAIVAGFILYRKSHHFYRWLLDTV